ncbi:MAG: M36 family metallopeptidase [Nocardioides sp.]
MIRKRTTRALTAGTLVLAAGLSSATLTSGSYAAGQPSRGGSTSARSETADSHEARGFYDASKGGGSVARATRLRTSAAAAAKPAARTFARSLPARALLEYDGSTGTVRVLENLDGFLTGPSSASAPHVALSYVRAHRAALGLTSSDFSTFSLHRDYRDIAGIHHLSWTQTVGGSPVFGHGLSAAVDKRGRLLMVGGSPVSQAPAPSNRLGTPPAVAAGDSVSPVVFVTPHGSSYGWQTISMSSDASLTVRDASSDRLLYRRPLGSDASGEQGTTPKAEPLTRGNSSGLAHVYFPGHRPGGSPARWDFTGRGWLGKNAQRLNGNNSHTYSDVDDNNRPSANEEVGPKRQHHWSYRLTHFHPAGTGAFCDNPYPCSWNPDKPFSWRKNRAQNATQVFFFVNNWHDHLMRSPIGFTEAAGNFQRVNKGTAGKGGDAVDTQTDDGANTDAGLPDGSHIDNANMDTPPDGHAPRMQMYLQHAPGSTYPDGDPFSPTNVGDEADTVYHEYTHGLSNRLVVDVNGVSTLGNVQAGAMGEAWSDWYAMDYLVDQGLQKDVPGKVDVVMFQYDGAGVALDRSEPMDCAVGSADAACGGGRTGHGGGYTYADYAQVTGSPEVHADGEIWAQTLWALRSRLGSKVSESLVTRAMELAPGDPSFLDMRNGILLADTAIFGGSHHAGIWSTFAKRGMGFFAGSLDGGDAAPAASFATPPATIAKGTISGVVTDQDSGQPVAGVPVTLAFQGGGGIANPTTTTGPDGSYTLGPVPAGEYGKLVVNGSGYDPARTSVTVTAGGSTADFSVRRDWAASSGGASVQDFNGPDYTPYGCGPVNAIDNSQATGWSSTTGDDAGDPTNVFVPKHVTVDLGRAINVTEFGVDPSATCGDGGSASTGDYRIETSTDGVTWVPAAQGTFTVDDRGRINPVTPTGGTADVRYVRFTILGNQTPDFATNCPGGSYSGCSYTDLTELEVYGAPAP